VSGVLREYARYFIGPDQADQFGEGLMGLEKNWIGPLAENQNVEATLKLFQTLEKSAPPQLKLNWRFQQALYRAYYDAYVYRRLIYERKAEGEALDELRKAGGEDILPHVDRAEQILELAISQNPPRNFARESSSLARRFSSRSVCNSVSKNTAASVAAARISTPSTRPSTTAPGSSSDSASSAPFNIPTIG